MQRQLLLAVVASAAIAGLLSSDERAASGALAQSGPPRLVVFELFDSTCATCRSAGAAVDTLAQQYEQANKPVVFIEYNSSAPVGYRIDRWYEACPNWQDCYLPLDLVDSGWRWSCGPKDFLTVYSDLVNQALANPAGADLAGSYTRSGNNLDVRLQITNRSGRSLGPDNDATAHVIVFERTKVLNTSRFARAAAEMPLAAVLPDGAQRSVNLRLAGVPMGQWDRAVVVVLLDYRPNPAASQRHEALQAAIAVEALPPTATPPPPSPTPTRSATPPPSPTRSATETAVMTGTPTPIETPVLPSPGTATTVWPTRPLYFPLVVQAMEPATTGHPVLRLDGPVRLRPAPPTPCTGPKAARSSSRPR